jgi:hypothetical protein
VQFYEKKNIGEEVCVGMGERKTSKIVTISS